MQAIPQNTEFVLNGNDGLAISYNMDPKILDTFDNEVPMNI